MANPATIRTIMMRIERGRLRPGERIMPQEVAQRLGTSATPVREALCQLVGREILVERHREGFYVASLTSATLGSLYTVHGRIVEMILHRWRPDARLDGRAKNLWRLFGAISLGADDNALEGVQRHVAGRLAVARAYEVAHVPRKTTARDLTVALRAGNIDAAQEISRDFHEACNVVAARIWHSMSDR